MNFSKTFLGLKVTRYEHNEWKLGKTFRVFVFRKTFQMQMMITQRSHHIQGLARSLQWYSYCMSAEQYELTYRRSRVPEQYLTARKSSYSEWFPMVSKDCRVQRIKRQFPLLHLVQGDTSQIPQTYWLPKIFTDSYKHYLTLTLLISDDFIMYISYSILGSEFQKVLTFYRYAFNMLSLLSIVRLTWKKTNYGILDI